ncbi:filamentous hemagglutinin N-terminal domain-containing protein [Xanthomonas sp. 3058]|uniref:two-partner secretion domain-containing protein n=1 Tax=Xanthomonas sp. 3058 TaxID=3035314 RepID=UPI0017A74223|nr:filamentous hemagglutinin N-terminal domain-containing protein [Xanthomonas sp. 3058]MBB5863911.1 filamentous hemagglutinin family protein [Xanthomonas sp. 3058]
MNLVQASSQATGPATANAHRRGLDRMVTHALSAALLLALAPSLHAAPPSGGVVTTGTATIDQSGGNTRITQTTQKASINWQDFSIGSGESVQFVQPGASSIALNRVLGANPSLILGNLSANGQVFLLNPNGILFGKGSSVNVGGLVASTMNISDADFQAGRYAFTGAGSGSVVNQGNITTGDGGYVALMGRSVSNQGLIVARLGTVALAAGEAVTLDMAGDGLLNVAVSAGAMNALAENGGIVRADGGRVLMTAQSADMLMHTSVNNTGVVQARTIEQRNGTILLLADMHSGTVTVGGVLDASAPNGGDGGFVETSAAKVSVGAGARITTAAAAGRNGRWLIDPQDFTVGSAPGDNIAGSTLSAQLVTNNVEITTSGAGTENGDIFVNDAIVWSASGGPTTLTLTANRNVDINAPINATNGNLAVCCGQDVNVNSAITTTNGSVLLSAGRDINQRASITVTDGNLMMCAANNVNISGAITLTRGTNDPTRSLGLPLGVTLSADTDGTGPGIEGGTVVFDALAPPAAVTVAPVRIYYNPVSYTTPTDYSTRFTLTQGAALSQAMLVFANGGDKAFNGTTATTLSGLKGNPDGVVLVAGPGASANFDTADAGSGKGISFTGYTLAGTNAGAFALPLNCCGTVVAHTTGTITALVPTPTTPTIPTNPTTPTTPTTPANPTTPTTPTTPTNPTNPTTPGTTTPTTPTNPTTPGTTTVPGTREPFFVPPPRPELPLLPPQTLLVVTPPEEPPQTLSFVTPEPVPVPVKAPAYVAPMRAPKPYRN